MGILTILAGCLLVTSFNFGTTMVQCATNETRPGTAKSAFSVEMLLTKLQVLEYHILKTDLQMDKRVTALSSTLDNLVKSVEQLSRTVQQMGEKVHLPVFEGKQIAENLSAIRGELKDLNERQKQLLTSEQFENYIIDHGCNATNGAGCSESRGTNYSSCRDIPSKQSGLYLIHPEKSFKQPITVLCDQQYDFGGWTVIQHRFEGSVNFYRGWKEYQGGFGNLEGEFWLGLDRIHQMTASRPHELVVLLEDYGGTQAYAKYDRFEIGDEGQKYVLSRLDGFSGTAGDSLSYHAGMMFTTLDSDNDNWEGNCAVKFTGAWWYSACHKSNLNGQYLRGETEQFATGMVWEAFRGYHYSLKSSKMMIRPK